MSHVACLLIYINLSFFLSLFTSRLLNANRITCLRRGTFTDLHNLNLLLVISYKYNCILQIANCNCNCDCDSHDSPIKFELNCFLFSLLSIFLSPSIHSFLFVIDTLLHTLDPPLLHSIHTSIQIFVRQ